MKTIDTNGFHKISVVVFVILTVLLNVSLYSYTRRAVHSVCSADAVIGAIAVYLANNGEVPLDQYMSSDCLKVSSSVKEGLAHSVRALGDTCVTMVQNAHKTYQQPLLTLFTTHAAHNHTDAEKYSVHNNTLINWASFRPKVNLILFCNDSAWEKVARDQGWEVIFIAETDTPPLLKDMFEMAMSRFVTPWYGYVNADILFTETLMETVETISRLYDASSDRVLLTGRRLNVENFTVTDAASDSYLRYVAKTFGKLYRNDAEDFFIASITFPWKQLLPVVVGIPAYDNWLVAEARCRFNASVIDVTETLEAVHQTTKKGGNHEGYSHTRANYNFEVFKKFKIIPNYLAGLTDCVEYRTFRTLCGTVMVDKRTNRGKNCNCKKLPD